MTELTPEERIKIGIMAENVKDMSTEEIKQRLIEMFASMTRQHARFVQQLEHKG